MPRNVGDPNNTSGWGGTGTSYPTILTPSTPWYGGGADGGIANSSSHQELVNASGQTSRIPLPNLTVASLWRISMKVLITADSANWTPVGAGVIVFKGDGTQAAAAEERSNSNQGRQQAGSLDWVSLGPEMRVSVPANSSGWYARPSVYTLGPYGGLYNRGVTYSDFAAERIG
jgi:hypothetical protein